jgi:hypothetical protein
VSCQRQLITVREVAQNRFQLRGKGFLGVWEPPWPGAFLLRKIVRTTGRGRRWAEVRRRWRKLTGSNRIITVSELKNLVYQKTLAVGSKRSQLAPTQTQVEKYGVLRGCCDGEARALLNDHF